MRNEHTGAEIKFNAVGQKKTIRAGEDLLCPMPALPDMLRLVGPIGVEIDRRGPRGIKAVHR